MADHDGIIVGVVPAELGWIHEWIGGLIALLSAVMLAMAVVICERGTCLGLMMLMKQLR